MWMCEECFRSNPDRNNVCFCGRIRGVDFEECKKIINDIIKEYPRLKKYIRG